MRLRLPTQVAVAMARRPEQFEVQTFRAGGRGGQNQNKRNTGVRIIDTVTGLSAESREHRTQHQNRSAAFERLVQRMVEHYRRLFHVETAVSTEVIRSYKFPSGVVVDHRTGQKYPLDRVMQGDLSAIHDDLKRQESS